MRLHRMRNHTLPQYRFENKQRMLRKRKKLLISIKRKKSNSILFKSTKKFN